MLNSQGDPHPPTLSIFPGSKLINLKGEAGNTEGMGSPGAVSVTGVELPADLPVCICRLRAASKHFMERSMQPTSEISSQLNKCKFFGFTVSQEANPNIFSPLILLL